MKLTEEQRVVAHAEGWAMAGGILRRTFKPDGSYAFFDLTDVYRFVYARSAESSIHHDVFVNLVWCPTINMMAIAQGWALHSVESTIYACSPFDTTWDKRPLRTDEDAQNFIQQQAENGDAMAILAVKTIALRKLMDRSY